MLCLILKFPETVLGKEVKTSRRNVRGFICCQKGNIIVNLNVATSLEKRLKHFTVKSAEDDDEVSFSNATNHHKGGNSKILAEANKYLHLEGQ